MCAIENEYKFVNYNINGINHYYDLLKSFVDEKGIKYIMSEKNVTDFFFDTDNLDISKKGCMFRRREIGNNCKLTVKKPLSSNGLLTRVEIEKKFDGKCSYEDMSNFCRENLGDLKLSKNPLFSMNSIRHSFNFETDEGMLLTLDDCCYYDGPFKMEFIEIELEIVSDKEISNFDNLGLSQFVTEKMDFTSVTKSKFERGLAWKESLPEHESY